MSAIGGEYEDKKQAYAICMNTWRESKKTDERVEDHNETTSINPSTFIIKSEKKFIIGGYANVYMLDKDGKVVPDRDKEVVNLKALDEALQLMMSKESRRNHIYWHTNMQIGEIIWDTMDSDGVQWKTHVVYEPDEQYVKKGAFILSEMFDDNPLSQQAKEQMQKGELLEFSIGGLPLETENKCDEDKCWTEITRLYLGEVSSCENAINVESKAFIIKSEDTKILAEVDRRLKTLEEKLLKHN